MSVQNQIKKDWDIAMKKSLSPRTFDSTDKIQIMVDDTGGEFYFLPHTETDTLITVWRPDGIIAPVYKKNFRIRWVHKDHVLYCSIRNQNHFAHIMKGQHNNHLRQDALRAAVFVPCYAKVIVRDCPRSFPHHAVFARMVLATNPVAEEVSEEMNLILDDIDDKVFASVSGVRSLLRQMWIIHPFCRKKDIRAIERDLDKWLNRNQDLDNGGRAICARFELDTTFTITNE